MNTQQSAMESPESEVDSTPNLEDQSLKVVKVTYYFSIALVTVKTFLLWSIILKGMVYPKEAKFLGSVYALISWLFM